MKTKKIDKLISLFKEYKSDNFDKYSWQSPHSLTKLITKPFDANGISAKVAKKRGVSQQSLLDEWRMEGAVALEKGNIVHNAIGNKFKRKMTGKYITNDIADRLISYAEGYIKDTKSKCITKEKLLTYKDKRLFGFLDYLAWSEKDDKLILVDWKTNKKIDRVNVFENFKKPLSSIDASRLNIYSLQMSFYKYLILNVFGIDVDEMHIVWLNEKNSNYEVIKASNMTKSIDKVLQFYKHNISIK